MVATFSRTAGQEFTLLWPFYHAICKRERTLYPQLLMLKYLLLDGKLWNEMFSVPFHSVIEEYKEFIEEKHIGLPTDWRERL